QAEDGIRDYKVTGVQTCALPIYVYDAWSEERGCRCIAKAVRSDLLRDRETRLSLFLEARLLLRLSHPHLVRAYELVRGPRPTLRSEERRVGKECRSRGWP